MNGSITFEFLCPQKFEDFHARPCLAKISLWSVWRDLEKQNVWIVVNYMKIFKFLWISTQFQKFLRRYGAFLKLKTLELRSGDTHKNSNVPQMLLAFEETV